MNTPQQPVAEPGIEPRGANAQGLKNLSHESKSTQQNQTSMEIQIFITHKINYQ